MRKASKIYVPFQNTLSNKPLLDEIYVSPLNDAVSTPYFMEPICVSSNKNKRVGKEHARECISSLFQI